MQKVLHILIGCLFCSIGILMLRHAHLVTGGAPGLALGLSYLFGVPFAPVFLAVNFPFYILSIFRMGWNFTMSTVLAAIILSLMTMVDQLLPDILLPAWAGALFGGAFAGFGLAYLFWNGSSLGGVNILTLYLQRQFGWDPGKTSCIMDTAIVLTGVYSVGLVKGVFSVLSVVLISIIISYYKGRIANTIMTAVPASELAD
ncbi:MAG: putative rane protein [Firmicutes bacterium]|nr:putative rane protein [Bacillota bacterium]